MFGRGAHNLSSKNCATPKHGKLSRHLLLSSSDPHAASSTKAPFLYASCAEHADCDPNQFCGAKCWTGGCDEGKHDHKGKKHERFCQPCTKCKQHNGIASRSCEICEVSGNEYSFTRFWIRCAGAVFYMVTIHGGLKHSLVVEHRSNVWCDCREGDHNYGKHRQDHRFVSASCMHERPARVLAYHI